MSIRKTNHFGLAGLFVAVLAIVALTGQSLFLSIGQAAEEALALGDGERPSPHLYAPDVPSALGESGATDTDKMSADASGDVEDGAEIYMTRCMSCHQMNGRGVPGVFPPLVKSRWVTEDKGVLIRIVLNGMTGEVEVDGEVYSGAMPPWQTFLDDEQTADLLTYIRTSWSNDTTAVMPDEVAAVRKLVTDRKQPWTQEELLKEENRGIPEE